VNAQSSGSILADLHSPGSPYKILQNDSNGHGCCFKNYYYSNIGIIHVQWPTNLSKSMWKLVSNVTNVIF
jgi:hypothetical protein